MTPRRALVGAAVLGFALGGFFDGILLHQILEWHHLLSLVPGAAFRSLRVQLIADGLLHVVMYLVAVGGLLLLWRARATLARLPGRHVVGAALVGFATWHCLDAVLNHWLLGIHHIRDDAANPVAYDLVWVGVFGLGLLALGLRLLRQPAGGNAGGRIALGLAVAAVAGAGIAGLPPRGVDTAVALFAPGSHGLAAAASAGSRIVWADPSGLLVAVQLVEPGGERALRRHGALFVTRSPALAGCLAASA